MENAKRHWKRRTTKCVSESGTRSESILLQDFDDDLDSDNELVQKMTIDSPTATADPLTEASHAEGIAGKSAALLCWSSSEVSHKHRRTVSEERVPK